MNASDEKIRTEVLQVLYSVFESYPDRRIDNGDLADELPSISKNELNYILKRMEDEYADLTHYSGGLISAKITAQGIEHLTRMGASTFLESNVRYELLESIYYADRQKGGYGRLGRDAIVDALDVAESVIVQNAWYLKEKGLIEIQHGNGGQYIHSISITSHGREKFEAYRDSGVEIPASGPSTFGRQRSISPGEQQQAEHLFRDIVEMARDEVLILDRYARKPLYDSLLNHVPNGVDIRVLTSSRVTGSDYTQKINDFEQRHPEIKVREVSDSDWDFHDRYVFRDRDMGWAWGHSFHDAGDTQHTATELAPINRGRTLKLFEKAWKQGTQVN